MPIARAPIPVSEWRDPRHIRGLLGEQAALAWLRGRGWFLEAHRFRVGRHDLDLVVRQGGLVAFVEVKTRAGTGFGAAVEAVGWRKRLILHHLAEVWRQRHGRPGDTYRFDVAAVRWSGQGRQEVELLEDAWRVT